ncbi:MAG: amidohydrolase family protein [Woeseiaceae bacterium]|nr:amidohydrolase family protein [Woeseiaceae bacterium]
MIKLLTWCIFLASQTISFTVQAENLRHIRCGKLIDGISNEVRNDQLIVINNDRIEAVEEFNETLNIDFELIDLKNYTCLPGLIDTHTHITEKAGDTADLSIYFTMIKDDVRRISEKNALTTLNAGFTSVRNVGAYIAWSARDLRDRINQGYVIGPRIQTAGFYLTVPGGGGDLLLPDYPEERIPSYVREGVSKNAQEFRENAKKAVEGGADFLKILASGAVLAFDGVPGAPEMTQEEISAVVSVAKKAGIKVTSHAHGAQSIKDSILAGVDSIEHASLADQEAIDLAASHNVAFSMDVYNGDHIRAVGEEEGWPEEFIRKNNETTDAQRDVFSRALAAGVPITFGTDAAVYPHGDNARQFSIMVRHGMSPMQAIKSATSVAAKYIGWEDRVGSIKQGLCADIIAVRGDPLMDITLLQDVQVVVKGGSLIKSERINK